MPTSRWSRIRKWFWKQDKPAWITAIATGAATIALCVYVYYTYKLWVASTNQLALMRTQENTLEFQQHLVADQQLEERRTFDIMNAPSIEISAVRADSLPDVGKVLQLQIQNTGNTPAHVYRVMYFATSDISGLRIVYGPVEVKLAADIGPRTSIYPMPQIWWVLDLKRKPLYLGAEIQYKDMRDSNYVYTYLGNYKPDFNMFFTDKSSTHKLRDGKH